MFDGRLFHFIKKEFIQLLRDPRMLFVAVMSPLVQLTVFGYIASLDIKHISTAVFDEDRSVYSRQYLDSYKNSGYFDLNYYVDDQRTMVSLLDDGRVKLALRVPPGFGRKVVRGETAAVQAVLDGSNSSTAAVIQGYIGQINFNNVAAILGRRYGLSPGDLEPVDLNQRIWYNPELKSRNYMVPALFALVLMMISMILTSNSIVKEKEHGTMEMLAVTPLRSYELILGKILPFAIVSFLDILLVFLVVTLWFGIMLKGSVWLLFALATLFMATNLGLGVFISTVSQTQRQAMMTITSVMAPQFILSGFVFPIANMPPVVQAITYLVPLRYFLEIVRGLFLKGVGFSYLWNDVWPLFVFAVVILGLSIVRFKKKIE
ncbi:MAG: ABC transporter permease [Candidatus Margulisiibacteriota bacterium]